MMLEVRTEVRRPLRFFRMRVENKPYLQLKRQELIKRVSLLLISVGRIDVYIQSS